MALHIVFNDKLTAADHVSLLLTSSSSLLYVLRVLRDHKLLASSFQDVYRATVLAKITYCYLSWSGLCLANDRARLDAYLRCSKRYRYCIDGIPTTSELFAADDESLFE